MPDISNTNQVSLTQLVQSVQQCCTDNKMSVNDACFHVAQNTPGVTPSILGTVFIQLKTDASPVELIKLMASAGYPLGDIVEQTFSHFNQLSLTDLCNDLNDGFNSAGVPLSPEDLERSIGELITDHPGNTFSSSLPAIQGQGGGAAIFLPLYDPEFSNVDLVAVQTAVQTNVILANTGSFIHIYEVTAQGGNLKKIIAANGAFYRGITSDATAFYVTDTADNVSAYSYDGNLLWQLNDPGMPKLAVNDHALFHFAEEGLSAIDKSNGHVLWTQGLQGFSRMNFDIAADNDKVLYKGVQTNADGSYQLLVQALDGQTGNIAWTWVRSDGDPFSFQAGAATGFSINRNAAVVGYGNVAYYLNMNDGKEISTTYVDVVNNMCFNTVTVGNRLLMGTQGIAGYVVSAVFNQSGYFPGEIAVKQPVDPNTNGPTYPVLLGGQRVAMVYFKGDTTEVDVVDLSQYIDNYDLKGTQKYVIPCTMYSPAAQTFTSGDIVYGVAVQSKGTSLNIIVALPM